MFQKNNKIFVKNRPTTALELLRMCKSISNFRGVFCFDNLPFKPWHNESCIINLCLSHQEGTHRVCFEKKGQIVRHFNSFGNLKPPIEIVNYLRDCKIFYNRKRHQNFSQSICGQLCVLFLKGRLG